MAEIKIRLLGQFQVIPNGNSVTNFASDKVRALFAYLVAEAHFPHRREILADLLWPDKPESTARANLRRALANLRQVIQDHGSDPPHLLISRQDIQFNSRSDAWVDVHQLDRLHSLGATAPDNIDQYKSILQLYQGEFLAGFYIDGCIAFDEWMLMMREQLSRKATDIFDRATRYYETRHDFEGALPFAWKMVELVPWQEEARRQLMRLLASSGKRDEAIHQYQILEETLENELGIEPEPQTRKLIEQIRTGKQKRYPQSPIGSDDTSAALPDFLQQETLTPLSAPETFVARQEEISQLHKLLESVLAGQGRVAFVAGEAGSGKTTLIREFIQQAQSQHPRLVSATGYCNAFTGFGDPYLPFREVLNQLSGDIETHLKAGLFSRDYAVRLWQAVPATCQALLNFGPDLIGTIIPTQSLREYISPLSNFNNNLYKALDELIQQKQSQAGSPPSQPNIFSQCGAVLQAVAKNTPLILVLDDLQWADSGTISMLFHLGKHLAGNRILILGAYRSEEVQVRDEDQRHPLAPVLAEFKKDIGEIIINLDQSSHKDFVEELIASEPNEFDQAFHESLFLHTRGHPLFTVELIRDLQDKSALVKNSQGRWVTKSEFKIDSLPPKVEGIISERINRLPRVLQRILTVASIEGEVFTAEIIAGVEELPVSQVVDYLSDHLGKQHRLVRAQEINVVNGHTISSYRFRHILFQKYLYSRLDEIEVVNLHGRVGSEMETLAGENKDRYSVNLARHFHHSKQIGKAVAYYAMAGERAVSMSAYPEAIGHFEESIKLLRTLPETPSRKEQELDLQLQLGLAYQAIMGFANEKVGQAYQRARELSLNVENPIKLITTLHLLLSYYSNMAEFDTGYEIMALLEQSYKELGEEDSHDTVLLDWAYGYLDHLLGQYKSAYEHFERAIAHYNPDKYDYLSAQMGMDAGIYCHNWAGLHAVWMGYPDKAKVYNRIALKIAEGHNSKLFTNDALCFSTWISLELEDIAAAKEFSEAFLELTTNEHYFFFEALAWAFKGRILFREGKHQDAIASIQKGLEMDQMTGMVVSQEIFLHALAEAYCAAGQAEDGLEVILKAEQAEEKTGDARFKSFLQRIKGELYLLTGDEVAAEEAYLAAIATAQKQSAKLLELEAVKKLARLWHKQGKTQQAIEKLAEVYNWFTEGFDTPMLVRARELLEKMKGEVKG